MLYFITESYLKTNTPITANVDVTDVFPYVATQAQLRVMPILGTVFYNHLLEAYNDQTLTPEEEQLVAFIQPVIAWRSAEDAVFGLTYQLSVSRSEVAFGMEHFAQKAAFFEMRLIRYLVKNRAEYPIFISHENRDTDLRPQIECTQCIGDCFMDGVWNCGYPRNNGYNNQMLVI
jgi:hypothetical protein